MEFIVGVECNWVRCALWARPEGVSVLVFVVIGEHRLKVTDVMVVIVVEEIAGDLHAPFKLVFFGKIDNLEDLLELRFSSRCCRVLLQLGNEFL